MKGTQQFQTIETRGERTPELQVLALFAVWW